MTIILIAIAVIIGILILWGVGTQNKLVHMDELCRNSLSQIGVQLKSRWDALSALADLAKEYSNQEYRTLVDVMGARRPITGTSSAGEIRSQQELLAQSFGRVNALAESYPELKSNTVYLKTMEAVREYEEKVRIGRMVYNDTVTKFNRMVRAFPGSFMAAKLGFTVREYLQDDSQKTEMPDMKR